MGQYTLMALIALEVFLGHSCASISPEGLWAPGCLLEHLLARAELGGHMGGSREELGL